MVEIGVLQNRPKMTWLLIVFQEILINATVFATEENSLSRSAFFITRENKRLAGHVVKRLKSASLMSCSQSCLRYSWCTSTNFKESFKKDDKATCELNKHEIAPIDINEDTKLTDQAGVTFSMLLEEASCTSQSKNRGKCYYDYNNRRYSCRCEPPYHGIHCEKSQTLSFRFTTLGMQGNSGPTSTAGYTNTSLQGAVLLDKGIQIWTVPLTAMYSLTAAGASGGDALSAGGHGAVVSGVMQLVKGTRLRILIGQKGVKGTSSAGGGGGTFVADGGNTLLAAAGGGGGGSGQITSMNGDNGQKTESGSVFGGVNGLGGFVSGTESNNAGGGGGFIGNGACCLFNLATSLCVSRTCNQAGTSYLNGGLGGNGNGVGGFGGGGAADNAFAGGGGGYSGGGVYATSFGAQGGGGGSYCTGGVKPSNDQNNADGYVLIALDQ